MKDTIDSNSTMRLAVALAVFLALSAGAVDVAAANAQANGTDVPSTDAFVVSVHEGGDAEVSLVAAFDRTSDAEKRAFRQLERNETKRRLLGQRFAGNLRHVVAAVENRTGREMAIADPTVSTATAENGTAGVVVVSVTWTNLAAERGESLVVEEPFASDFETERAFVLRAPDGYAFDEPAPTPDSRRGGTATWAANRSLDGFRVAMEPNETAGGPEATSDEPTATDASGSVPGFGIVGAIAALVAGALLAARP